MRTPLTLFYFLLLSSTVNAQKLTGIWRGYFHSSPISREGIPAERYKYEVQINQLVNNSLSGVTYSYRSTVFYGKAELRGILTLPAKSLILKETKLVELKVTGKSEPCLMTCYLDYIRIGKLEVLQGTFISENSDSKSDCGSGGIYLEKVPESDFGKEDFLVKRIDTAGIKPITKSKIPGIRKSEIISLPRTKSQFKQENNLTGKPNTAKPPTNSLPQNAKQKNNAPLAKNTPKTSPPKQDEGKSAITTHTEKTIDLPIPTQNAAANLEKIEAPIRTIPVPKVLLERENSLVKIIDVNETDILVALYDNGTIDNDTVSVYHNNEKVISNSRLVYKPITLKIHCSKEDPRHELVIVAESLGDIPPNTALMVVTTSSGKQRFDINLTSNEQRNAKVVINYVPKN